MGFSRQPGEHNSADINSDLATDLTPAGKSDVWRDAPGSIPPVPPAQTLIGALGRVARFDAALAMATPVLAATTAAWWQSGALNVFALLFMFAGAFFGALGVNLLIEYHDRLRAQEPQVQVALQFINGKSAKMGAELFPGQIHSLAYIALLISFVCSLWMGLLIGWPLVLFSLATIALGVAYCAPPIRYGTRGFGLGESGLFIGLGLLPAMGSYYAQMGTIDALALWSGVPFAILVSLIGIAGNLFNYRRDWLIRKRTLAVVLGPARAIDLSTVLLIGAFVFILFASVVSALPLRTMVALLALPIATSAYTHIDREQLPPAEGLRLYTASIHATLAAALFYLLALATDHMM